MSTISGRTRSERASVRFILRGSAGVLLSMVRVRLAAIAATEAMAAARARFRGRNALLVVFADIADVVVVEVGQLLGCLTLFANALESPPSWLPDFHGCLLALVQIFDEVVDIQIFGVDSGLVALFLVKVV